MSSTATLNRREIARLQSQRAHLVQEAASAGESAVADILGERIAEIDRAIAWCQREIEAEWAAA